MLPALPCVPFFFFNDTATTEIYTLSLHDALPISTMSSTAGAPRCAKAIVPSRRTTYTDRWIPCPSSLDRKSTRLNSSHGYISYAVFCLKKKKNHIHETAPQQANEQAE